MSTTAGPANLFSYVIQLPQLYKISISHVTVKKEKKYKYNNWFMVCLVCVQLCLQYLPYLYCY